MAFNSNAAFQLDASLADVLDEFDFFQNLDCLPLDDVALADGLLDFGSLPPPPQPPMQTSSAAAAAVAATTQNHSDDTTDSDNGASSPEHTNDASSSPLVTPHANATLPEIDDMPPNVAYPQAYRLRMYQLSQGMSLDRLTEVQMGLQPLERCHHISINHSVKDGPPSYRVRVCKTCCRGTAHIELGTYVDQESAILVNDCHEIINGRYHQLILLTQEDEPFLHMFTCRRYNRHRGEELCNVLELLGERAQPPVVQHKKKRRFRDESEGGVESDEAALADGEQVQLPDLSNARVHLPPPAAQQQKLSQKTECSIVHTVTNAFSRLADDFILQGLVGADSMANVGVAVYKIARGEDLSTCQEYLYAASAIVLLSMFAAGEDESVRHMVKHMRTLRQRGESQDPFLLLSQLVEDYTDPLHSDTHALLQAAEHFLNKCQFRAWLLMYSSRFPKWEGENVTSTVERVEQVTSQLLLHCAQTRHTIKRFMPFFDNLHQQLQQTALMTQPELISVAERIRHRFRSAYVWYTVAVTNGQIRMTDCTGSAEYVESATNFINEVRQVPDMTMEERFTVELQTLTILMTQARLRADAGANPSKVLLQASETRNAAVNLAVELGMIEQHVLNREPSPQVEKYNRVHRSNSQIERLLMLYTNVVDHFYMSCQYCPVAITTPLPYSLDIKHMMLDHKKLLEEMLVMGPTLVYGPTARALYIVIKISKHILQESPTCSVFARSLAQAAMTVLQHCGQHFNYFGYMRELAAAEMRTIAA